MRVLKETIKDIILPICIIVSALILAYAIVSNFDYILHSIGEAGAKIAEGFQEAKK